jgi:hypothetical protein
MAYSPHSGEMMLCVHRIKVKNQRTLLYLAHVIYPKMQYPHDEKKGMSSSQ